ncbi:MAG: hypothetical protein H6Q69_2096 [Firmicutes bacterium]|nr:hypothetical protein [Bacillota bacterium]
MNITGIWQFISNNADAIGVIIAISGIIGGIIGFFTKVIIEHVKKKKSSDAKIITDQQHTIEEQKNQILTLTGELDKYCLVQKSTVGDVWIQKKTNTIICPICWSNSQKPIPVFDSGDGYYTCSKCNHTGIYSYNNVNAAQKNTERFIDALYEQDNNYLHNDGLF